MKCLLEVVWTVALQHYRGRRQVFPGEVLSRFRSRETYIGVLELACPAISLLLWGARLAKAPCLFFVDNDGAGFALAKRLSGDKDFDALLSCFWGLATSLAVLPWV